MQSRIIHKLINNKKLRKTLKSNSCYWSKERIMLKWMNRKQKYLLKIIKIKKLRNKRKIKYQNPKKNISKSKIKIKIKMKNNNHKRKIKLKFQELLH